VRGQAAREEGSVFSREGNMSRYLPASILAVVLSAWCVVADTQLPKEAKDAVPLPQAELRFTDGSGARVFILQESIDIVTRYGKLTIPARDIRKIEVGFRPTEGTEKKIEEAIKQLGSDTFAQREAASKELAKMGAPAYWALKKVVTDPDKEVARRASILVKQLVDTVPAERLQIRVGDFVQTTEFPVAGRIINETLKVRNKHFGETELKLSELAALQVTAGSFHVTDSFTVQPAGFKEYHGKSAVFKGAYFLERGDLVGAKAAVASYDQNDMCDLVTLFAMRRAPGNGGLGIGSKPGAIKPDGIEKLLNELAEKPINQSILDAHGEDMARAFYITAAVGEAHRPHSPVKQLQGKKDPKKWEEWSVTMRDTAIKLAEAARARQSVEVKTAAVKLNNVCNSCHEVFRQ
jgi:hypothetical protein